MSLANVQAMRALKMVSNVMTDFAIEHSETIVLSASNTTLLTDKIYASNGTFQDQIGRYNTLYYPVGNHTGFLLSNYAIGVLGGAFVDQNKVWISSFATDGANASVVKKVPVGAYYIAISVNASNMYYSIVGYYNTYTKKLDPETIADALPVGKNYSDTIILSASNTTLLTDKIYASNGTFQDQTGKYNTLYYPVGKYTSFLIANYSIGVYGGAFVDQNKVWISSFQTDGGNASVVKNVPNGAYYIAISVNAVNMYYSIVGYYTDLSASYKLTKLLVDSSQVIGASSNNQWAGKKIVWLGTSVPFGQYATASYALEAANKLGFNLVNTSAPGEAIHINTDGTPRTYGSTTLSIAEYQSSGSAITIESAPIPYTPGGSYNDYWRTWEHIFTSANADADLWVYDVVPNNVNFATTDWDAFDKNNWVYKDGSTFDSHRTTFLGALLFMMDKMYTLNPKARMVFVLGSAFSYSSGLSNFQLLQSQWNIPLIDVWKKVNTSPKSYPQVVVDPATNSHPSTYGHQRMGSMMANELLLIS